LSTSIYNKNKQLGGAMMEQKPHHYDGSAQNLSQENNTQQESMIITDEMRKNIGQNPYFLESSE
jgi:hypothetical protein